MRLDVLGWGWVWLAGRLPWLVVVDGLCKVHTWDSQVVLAAVCVGCCVPNYPVIAETPLSVGTRSTGMWCGVVHTKLGNMRLCEGRLLGWPGGAI